MVLGAGPDYKPLHGPWWQQVPQTSTQTHSAVSGPRIKTRPSVIAQTQISPWTWVASISFTSICFSPFHIHLSSLSLSHFFTLCLLTIMVPERPVQSSWLSHRWYLVQFCLPPATRNGEELLLFFSCLSGAYKSLEALGMMVPNCPVPNA